MCGLVGFFSTDTGRRWLEVCRAMTETLVHRGPDDKGAWGDQQAGIALGQRRLAIQDLSPRGHQPMQSESGRYVIAYNGEIYNFLELKKDLESTGCRFRGHADTEVLLAAVEAYGLDKALECFVGMFAFALWDRKKRVLTLVRDRMGEKPLYYGWQGKTFLFGSELKALRRHPDWQGRIDRDVLALYMRHNYIPTPYSIYKGIYKLRHGTVLQFSADTPPGCCPGPTPYWQAKDVCEYGNRQLLKMDETETVGALDRLLRETICNKMIADVPLGAFLSGGLDSSTMVALMQAESNRPVKTFSIGFHEEGYNEAQHAKTVAEYLGTEHTELYVTPDQAMEVIPGLPEIYDEPFSDSSQIPTFLVSKMTREHVTVALSGDGGDELFGGYNRYFWGRSIWQKIGWAPRGLRRMVASGLTACGPGQWDRLFSLLAPVLPAWARQSMPGDKLHKLASILAVNNPEAMYLGLVSHWKQPTDVVLGAAEPPTALTDKERWARLPDFTQRMMFLDMISYLPDDILVKVDRAAMSVSLETRVPFLDHRVVEFAWRLPMRMKIRGNQGKWILRQLLYKYVPHKLIDRPKMGFGVPIDSWLRGPLRPWAEELLNERRLQKEGFFNPQQIRDKWLEHLEGKRNWQYLLWDVLMFQAWYEHWEKS